ncbi:extensin family protein [Jannaschia sp. S6380]|uniref:extensin-like domain-containing protein n=1 Tax=Jannaschia sp. S6380 TaxID=2926408 RepID=UPI001FF18AB1|nr:extensin family protein [Jannaschia sp. S6380]MCK0166979.1 extensin family protein [Jannaschia sp. S6380]
MIRQPLSCLAAFLIFAGSPLMAQDSAPETSPEPVQRPPDEGADTETDAAGEVEADGDAAPEAEDALPGLPEEAGPSVRETLKLDDADYAACLAALDEMGTVYSEVEPIVPEEDADCGILRPIEVTEILPGIVVEPPATVRCPTARSLADWTQDFVLPAAERLNRGAVTALQNGTGYNCRRRNNQPDGKLSEHAFGNAFDLMGFTFSAGDPLPIVPRARDGTMEESFQDAVRAAACVDFATVLGPGSDPYHDDHLHIDIKARNSGFRLCEQGAGEGD